MALTVSLSHTNSETPDPDSSRPATHHPLSFICLKVGRFWGEGSGGNLCFQEWENDV